MKYWNKSRNTRLKHWICVKLATSGPWSGSWASTFPGRTSNPKFDQIKIELQRSPIKSRFYMNIMKREIWFENAKDATWVSLKYSGMFS